MLSNSYSPFKMGERIKKAMKRKGVTQEQLAEEIGVSRVTVTQWRTGTRSPSYEHLTKLCNALDIDTGYLFCEYNEKNYNTHKICELTGLNENAVDKLRTMQFENAAYGLADALSLVINHPNFEYLLNLIVNNATGTMETVSINKVHLQPNRAAIINSELKDTIISMAKEIRTKYTPNQYAQTHYIFLLNLYREGKITLEDYEDVKNQYDKGNFEYSPSKIVKKLRKK